MKEPQRLVSFRGYAIDTFIPFHVCMKAGTSYFAESKYGNTNVLKLLSSKKRHLVIPVTYGVSWTALDPFIFFFNLHNVLVNKTYKLQYMLLFLDPEVWNWTGLLHIEKHTHNTIMFFQEEAL